MRRGLVNLMFGTVICLLFQLTSQAQEVKVTGGFLKDSVRIGEPITYYLVASYPQSLTVLFPDSTFNVAPFELDKKKFFPTLTSNGISYDSVLYYLSTFEVDPVQRLSLPVFIVSARDCTAYAAQPDSVFLVELVTNLPLDSINAQNLPLKTNTLYERVFSEFNYILLMIIGGVLVVTAVLIWAFFGKRIIRYLKVKKLQKNHLKFLHAFTEQLQALQSVFSREKAEVTVSLWKKYLEQLEQKPYTKLTTRETMEMEPNEILGTSLQRIDRAIYGNQTIVHEPLQALKKIAEERFHQKLEELKNG